MENTGHLAGIEKKYARRALIAGQDEDGRSPPQGRALLAAVNIHLHSGISLDITKSNLIFD